MSTVHTTKSLPIKQFIHLAIPIVIQSLFSSSRTIVDTFMVNSLGETAVAAMGAAGKPIFVMLIMILAICNGSGVIAAQYWGKRSLEGVQKSVLYALFSGVLVLTPFVLWCFFAPESIIGIINSDHEVIWLGASYLRITCFSLIPLAISIPIYTGLSSMNQLKESTVAVVWGVLSNMLLNYLLIFGIGPFPELGLIGAAIGTVLSALSALLLLLTILRFRRKALLTNLTCLIHEQMLDEYKQYIRFVSPFLFNGLVWVSGIFIYFSILGNMSVSALAVLTVLAIPELIAVALYNGVQTASGIIIGQQLGAENHDFAQKSATDAIRITIILGGLVTFLVYLLHVPFLSFFSAIKGESYLLAKQAFTLFALFIFCKAVNSVIINGILRVGGDVRYIVISDAACHWLWGIPLAAIAAYYFHAPFLIVYACVISEECVKVGLTIWRYNQKKWVETVVDKGEKGVTFCCNSSS